jgi:hypothetical protein
VLLLADIGGYSAWKQREGNNTCPGDYFPQGLPGFEISRKFELREEPDAPLPTLIPWIIKNWFCAFKTHTAFLPIIRQRLELMLRKTTLLGVREMIR